MLVGSLFADVLLDTSATRTKRISGVQDVNDNITRVNDFVKLVPDTLALTLGEDGLSCSGQSTVGLGLLSIVDRKTTSKASLLETVEIGFVHLVRLASEIEKRADGELWALALSLGAKGIREGSGFDGNLCLVLLQAVLLGLVVLDQAHRQLVLLEQVRVRVILLSLDGATEGGQSILGDDTGVGEPFAVGLDTGRGPFTRLEDGGFCDVTSSVALSSAFGEDVELLDLLCVSAGMSACCVWVCAVERGERTCRSSRP